MELKIRILFKATALFSAPTKVRKLDVDCGVGSFTQWAMYCKLKQKTPLK